MLVNKTIAAKLAGVSRRTLYVHIKEKGISVVEDQSDGLEKIDVSELERIYGLEKISTNRKALGQREPNSGSRGGGGLSSAESWARAVSFCCG